LAPSHATVPQEQAEALGGSFEAPLREAVRAVRGAKAVMGDRAAALGALQQARAEVDAKRTKLAKLRGTPGIKARARAHDAAFRSGRPPGRFQLLLYLHLPCTAWHCQLVRILIVICVSACTM
jgi:hypothetical protein